MGGGGDRIKETSKLIVRILLCLSSAKSEET